MPEDEVSTAWLQFTSGRARCFYASALRRKTDGARLAYPAANIRSRSRSEAAAPRSLVSAALL